MPLVDSRRLTDEDRAAWPALIRCYRQPAWKVDEWARLARWHIERFLADGSAYVGVSWGKDSVVTAHLVRSVSVDVPLSWQQLEGAENPDSFAVRDSYLDGWPSNYTEVTEPVQWADDGEMLVAPWRAVLARAERELARRRIMGIRATESRSRSMSARVHGVATARVCRPILYWTTAEVFAYLLRHDLPIHPVYAMTMGGRLDMERLRVDFIGDDLGRGAGRREWELAYYGDRPPYSFPG